MDRVSDLLPKPSPAQLWLIECLAPRIEAGLRELGFPGGLITLRPGEGIFHTPLSRLDTLHVMALGLPEEMAVEVVEAARGCIPDRWAPVLLLDAKTVAFAFVNLRALPVT